MAEIIDCTKCAFYNNGKCDNPNGMSCNCINNAICYYKELKRLEQENAELKENFEGQRNAYKKLNSMYEENCEYTGKLEQTLQDIKEIAEGIRNATYQFGQEADQKFFNETLGKILQKITKAESEVK